MNKEEIVFSLSIADFESVLGRELTDDEIDTVMHKFSIDSWSEYVDAFFSARGMG